MRIRNASLEGMGQNKNKNGQIQKQIVLYKILNSIQFIHRAVCFRPVRFLGGDMFLCDELYEMGIVSRGKSDEEITKIGQEMLWKIIDISQGELKELVKRHGPTGTGRAIINRYNNHWNLAIDKLNKAGIEYYRKDAYMIFLKKEFPDIYNYVNSDRKPQKMGLTLTPKMQYRSPPRRRK